MKKSTVLVVVLALAVGIAVGVFGPRIYQNYLQSHQPPAAVAPEKLPVPPAPTAPAVRYPVPETAAPAPQPAQATAPPPLPLGPLPSLDQSDATIREVFNALFPNQPVERLLVLDHFIQRFVLLIDSLPKPDLPASRLPTRPVAGHFLVEHSGQSLIISPDNARRYNPYVRLAETVDTQRLVTIYFHLYPLFQEAYRQMGYPAGYFNDRLIEVIDQLLATPKVNEPIRLVQPGILYKFADPSLESLPAGQKILLRMGTANAEIIEQKLQEIRRALIAHPPSN
jgi:hypothetical protein